MSSQERPNQTQILHFKIRTKGVLANCPLAGIIYDSIIQMPEKGAKYTESNGNDFFNVVEYGQNPNSPKTQIASIPTAFVDTYGRHTPIILHLCSYQIDIGSTEKSIAFLQQLLPGVRWHAIDADHPQFDYAVSTFRKSHPNDILLLKSTATDSQQIPEFIPPEYYNEDNPLISKAEYKSRLDDAQKAQLLELIRELESPHDQRSIFVILRDIFKIIPSLQKYMISPTLGYIVVNPDAPEHPETTWSREDLLAVVTPDSSVQKEERSEIHSPQDADGGSDAIINNNHYRDQIIYLFQSESLDPMQYENLITKLLAMISSIESRNPQ